MKQKIKIMKSNDELTDEEVQGYMNFDALVHQRRKIVHQRVLLTVTGMVTVVLVAAFSIYYFAAPANKLNENTLETPQVIEANPEVNEPGVTTDTIETNGAADDAVILPERGQNIAENPKADASDQKKKVDKGERNPVEPTTQKEKEDVAIENEYLQAEPRQGYQHLFEYLNANLKYPTEAIPDSIQGVVTVSFIINQDGKVSNVDIVNSLGPLFDREAMKLVSQMPAWKPATLNGKPVKSKVSLPLTFELKKIQSQ